MPDKTDIDILDELIGQKIKLRRAMLRMSQDCLASIVGVTFQQIQKYEAGVNKVSASRLYLISRALDIEIGFFFAGIDGEDAVQESSAEFDPLVNPDTLKLVNAYWKIKDPNKRKHVLDFIGSLA